MNGFSLTEHATHGEPFFVAMDSEATEVQDAFELARRVIQGQSAAYLLSKVGARSLSDELQQTLFHISSWVLELRDAVRSKADHNVLARRMLPVVVDLSVAQRELSAYVSAFDSTPSVDPLAWVRRAHDRLEQVFFLTPLGRTPTSNGCALEIDHLVATRSN